MNNPGKTLHKERRHVVEVLLHSENKQIMPNNVGTQHKRMYTCIRNIIINNFLC